MFDSNWDKHTHIQSNLWDPRGFLFLSVSFLSYFLFCPLSITLYPPRPPPVSLDIHAFFWVHPLAFLSPRSLFLLSLPAFCSTVQAIPFAYGRGKKEKKNLRLVSNLNNWAAQFSSSWTLWGENGWGGDFVPRQGDRDEHVSGLCQYVFSQDEINANFICTLRQRGPDGNLALPLEQREGWRGEERAMRRLKWASDNTSTHPLSGWQNLGVVPPPTFSFTMANVLLRMIFNHLKSSCRLLGCLRGFIL